MKRQDFFLAAMKAEMFRNKPWIVSAFCLIQEGPEAWKLDPYPYRIIQTPTGVSFVNPENPSELLPLEDTTPRQPPFSKADKLDIEPGQVANATKAINTSYGNLLANYILLIWPFGNKIPFMEGKFSPDDVEKQILPLFVDMLPTPEQNAALLAKKPNVYFYDSYLKLTDAATFLAGLADIWVSGGTEKMLLPPPGVVEYRASLFKKYGIDPTNDATDPALIALVAKDLLDYDAAYLKGDDALNIMIEKKNFNVVRAKKYLMVGAEAGLSGGNDMELVPKSLHEGWDIDKMPAMVNNLRAGAFNRGAETMRGGEAVKWLLRASSNINILKGDCGTNMGKEVLMTPEMIKKYLNFTIIIADGVTQKLTEEVVGKYAGKLVTVRTPMYCKFPHTDYCEICAGPRLAENPTGASSAISAFGSTIMLMFMKANKGKALVLKKYDYKLRIV